MPDSVQITYSTYNNGDVRLNIFITDYIQDLIVKVGDYTCDGHFDIDTVGAHFKVSIREDTLGKYLKISPESFYIPTVDVSL